MPAFRGLIVRLTAFNAAVIAVILALSGTATYLAVDVSLNRSLNGGLERSAAALQGSRLLEEAFGDRTVLAGVEEADREDKEERQEDGAASLISGLVLVDARGRTVYPPAENDERRTEGVVAPDALGAALDAGRDLRSVSRDDGVLRVLTVAVTRNGRAVGAAQIVASESEQRRLLATLRSGLLVAGIGGLAAAVAGGLLLTSRQLAPVREAFLRQRAFVADASHAMRTPIAVIRADAEALQRSLTDLSPDEAQLLEDAVHESDFLAALVRDLVTLARMERDGRGDARETIVDVAALSRQLPQAVQALAWSRQVSVTADVPDSALPVRGDPVELRLALMALIDNAIKYNQPGGSVVVSARAEDGTAVVDVRDTGRGVPEDERERVFQRFYRTADVRGSGIGGAGLGLAIVREVVQRHGGTVSLASEPGCGTTVTVRLRLGTAPV